MNGEGNWRLRFESDLNLDLGHRSLLSSPGLGTGDEIRVIEIPVTASPRGADMQLLRLAQRLMPEE